MTFSAVSNEGLGSTLSKSILSSNPAYSSQPRDLAPFDVTTRHFSGNEYSLTEFFPKMIFGGCFIVHIQSKISRAIIID